MSPLRGFLNFVVFIVYKDNAPPGLVVSFVFLTTTVSTCLVLACPG